MNQLDLRIDGRYRLVAKLGEGGFGLVYRGVEIASNEPVAIKLEDYSIDPSVLQGEIATYRALQGSLGVPRVYWDGHEGDYKVMVFELLGPTLEDLCNYCSGKFTLKTVLLLADQLLHRLQSLHAKNVIHRDIKPENFLMGRERQGNRVYVVDLGISWSEHARTSQKAHSLFGTADFASISAHHGDASSEYDDLEALGYMLIYFLRGTLPWYEESAPSRKEWEHRALEMKEELSPAQLCQDLPHEFETYMTHIRERKEQLPDYARLRRDFRKLFSRQKFEYDNVFDWTLLKFLDQSE